MFQLIAIVCLVTCLPVISAVTRTATCEVAVNKATPDIDDQVIGTVTFTQEDEGDVKVDISLSGFNTADNKTAHGFHVHASGSIDGADGCTGAGGHYNPGNVDHAARTAPVRHVGDLGNIDEDAEGKTSTSFTDSIISMTGDHSIIGLAIVVHETEDDLGLGGDDGSKATGNAGSRLSCCVIEDTTSAAAAAYEVNLVLSLLVSAFMVVKNMCF